MKCVHCGTESELITVGFKAACTECGRYLHSCVQCSLFDGSSRRCRSLTTEAVGDRESCNFCEEFRPGGSGPGSRGVRDASDFEALFGGGE